ncbi:MAG: hypothetical protein [Cressdnaviricota sp.]|nr:MAG: hypothetical protein [Cressdnaviricota sp.]
MVLRYARKGKKGRKATRKPKMSFDKRVLSVINKQRELKVAVITGTEPINGTITGTDLQQILPDIAQADGEFNRDGNEITLKKIIVRGWITQTFPNDDSRSRFVNRLMIIRQKGTNANDLLASSGADFKTNSLLENSLPFIGDVKSLQTPVNRGAFVARYDRTHYLSVPAVGDSGNSDGGDLFNSFKMFQKTLTFGKGKKLYYQQGTSLQPTNFDYVMCCGASTVDAIPVDTGLTLHYTCTAYYYDS